MLYVVHGIVLNSGGKIGIRSQLGQSRVFDIHLPAIECKAQVYPEKEQILPYGTKFVLLIDDEPRIARMAKEHPENLGILYTGLSKGVWKQGPRESA